MTKEQLRKELEKGEKSFYDITHDEKNSYEWNWVSGQGCEIVKNGWYCPPDWIIYVSDTSVGDNVETDIPINEKHFPKEEIEIIIDDLLSYCYTRKDFLETVNGSEWAAHWLYDQIDWSSPASWWDNDPFAVDDREEMVECYGEDITKELETVCGLKF